MTILRAALAALVLLPALVPAEAAQGPRELELEVRFGPTPDVADLRPFDPRSEALVAARGEVEGLWTGEMRASGGLVRLVEFRGGWLGLVEIGPGRLAWATLVAGAIVPLDVPAPVETVDTELRAPLVDAASAPASDVAGDGKVQLFVDGDHSFHVEYGAHAEFYQLALLSLVDAIYQNSLDVEIEVVEQHVWTEVGPFPDPIRCGGDNDLLWQFRSHYESIRPTTRDPREEALILTSKPPVAHPDGGTLIGCGYIRELESSYAYASARVAGTLTVLGNRFLQPSGMATHALLVAHEMGHNFGGLHELAMPTPYSPFDATGCRGGTIMYPYLCQNSPVFSDATLVPFGLLGAAGLVQDRGNAPEMRAYAAGRI